MIASCAASQPRTTRPAAKAARRAMRRPANTAIAAISERTAHDDQENEARNEVIRERASLEPFRRDALSARQSIVAATEGVQCAEGKERSKRVADGRPMRFTVMTSTMRANSNVNQRR